MDASQNPLRAVYNMDCSILVQSNFSHDAANYYRIKALEHDKVVAQLIMPTRLRTDLEPVLRPPIETTRQIINLEASTATLSSQGRPLSCFYVGNREI